MEWITTQHLDLSGGGGLVPGTTPRCAAFHPSQALLAVAIGDCIVELDALTGCKLTRIDVGAPVARMAYSPAGGHVIVAVLEDWTIKSCDLDTDHTHVLYSPERKSSKAIAIASEVHIALTPLQPWLFFGVHRRLSVNVVGTVEGARPATKIKTDLKKPITDLACHPRSPLLYVAYLDGVVRAYNIQTFGVQYTLQIDNGQKLVGAGAFAFHSTLEWLFIGDRGGTLHAWDVSVLTRPTMIGITQVGSNAITAVAWHPMLKLLITLSKEGSIQTWRTKVINNPNRPSTRAHFFEPAGIEPLDIAKILIQQGGKTIYPLPRIADLLVHPKLNLAAVLFVGVSNDMEAGNRAAVVSREARRQLFSVLQGARGSSGSLLKDKLGILGSAGILPDFHLQLHLQQAKGHFGQSQIMNVDHARKAFLHNSLIDGHMKGGAITQVPLLTISEAKQPLRDIPVCQPMMLDLKFFNSEQRIFDYPVRLFFMDGCNLTAYNLVSGDYNIYKKHSPTALGGNERHPKHMMYSAKQNLFLIFFECRGATSEVVVYRDNTNVQITTERSNTIMGRDGAFIGPKENQYAILEDDGIGLSLHFVEEELPIAKDEPGSIEMDENDSATANTIAKSGLTQRASVQFTFDNPVQRVFSTPLESTIMYVSAGSHIGLAKLFSGAASLGLDEFEISTVLQAQSSVKLKSSEIVLQVLWQETASGQVAGILTTERVMITSANLEILSCASTTFDKGFPPFRSLLWAGPALLFSSATFIAVLGWDGVARPIVSIGTTNFALVGVLNDRLLMACTTDSNPRQKQGVEIRTRLLGLLEPLLIGWVTMQQSFDPKLDLSEIVFQLTSRFDSLRITPRSLDALAKGPPVCQDLAVELAQAGPQFTQVLRCQYAICARRFNTALAILKDEFLRSRDYPRCPSVSGLFQRFRELGHACIKYGQFDHAKETFEVVSDYESMLDLFICHLNPSALRRLAQKLEETGSNPELRRRCDKILSVRSSGWGQGGMFANFAADSMAPKGPEWAGGNWVIKTSAEAKAIPEWELSNEVTAYMKTNNGPIPTIVPDHLGVYLGTLKGRGTVVEVKADALARMRASPAPSDKGNNDLMKALQASADASQAKRSEESGLQGLMRKEGGGPVDEQSRAEKEFKQTLGLDDSSDEEDGTTSTKTKLKIVIRDKPVAGPAVDLNKVKEATQQFRLPVGPPPPSRTRSKFLTIPDNLPNIAPSTTTTTAPPVMLPVQDLLMPATSMQPQAPSNMVMGGGGAAGGPIPEDFFHNTTSAYEALANVENQSSSAAAPWPPSEPTTNPTTHQVSDISSGVPKANVITNDPFEGGVPPQAVPMPIGNAQFGNGVPPRFVDDGSQQGMAMSNPASLQNANVVNQGINDLVPVQTNAPARPSSPPLVLRPGQVPRGAPASKCFKAAVVHFEQNQLADALSCLDEAFLALAKDQSLSQDVRSQARICAQYKIAVRILQEITRLQRVQGPSAISAKDEMARLARHLSALPLLAKHHTICVRTAIKRNLEVQNYAYAKTQLDYLLSKAPANKQDELRSLINLCIQRGLSDRSIDPSEDASQCCSETLSRLPTIGHDVCDVCAAKFSTLNSPGCTICGMGNIQRSDKVAAGPVSSPFA